MTSTVQETDLRYPVGKFDFEVPINEADYPMLIAAIAETPGALRAAVAGLSRDQLETRYRPGGWTVRQVVHHFADSHMNAYVRFRLALTENEPTIKPYDEAAWAALPDSRLPVEESLNLIEALHARWVALLELLTDEDFQKDFVHPVRGRQNLATALALYDWHGRHHTAHITRLRARMGW